ncbi:MAG: xylulokinase [bacterium]|nr:xylulokinase [bacterium]
MPFLLGIDVGTTAVKSAMFSDEGDLIGEAHSEYETFYPSENAVEQMPEDWWQATVLTIQDVLQATHVNRGDIAAIGVSSQAPTMLAIDKKGHPLHPALIWMDQRSDAACAWLRQTPGEEMIFRVTGNIINPYYVLPELLWLKQNKPALYADTYKILQANGYINLKLTGQYTIDRSHAGLTLLYDIHQRRWAENLFDAVEIPLDMFPAISECHAVIGEVTEKAAGETGLKSGTPVIAGMVDATAAALEAGTIRDGSVCEMTGTSTVIMAAMTDIVTDTRLTVFPHSIQDTFLLIGAMSSSGASLKWFKNQLGLAEQNASALLGIDPYEVMNREVGNLAGGPSGIIFLPYLSGERSPIWDNKARGVFFGLSANTMRADLIKALFEGTAFGLKHNLDVFTEGGMIVREIRTVGGGAKSAQWNQIKADITNTPIMIPETAIGAPFGDGILAGYGIGLFPDLTRSIDRLVKIREIYEPRSQYVQAYQEMFAIYKDLYLHLQSDFTTLYDLKRRYSSPAA